MCTVVHAVTKSPFLFSKWRSTYGEQRDQTTSQVVAYKRLKTMERLLVSLSYAFKKMGRTDKYMYIR